MSESVGLVLKCDQEESNSPLKDSKCDNVFKPSEGDVTRKLLTRHRKLVIGLNNISKEFSLCLTKEQFNRNSDKFDALRSSVIVCRKDLNEIKDLSLYEELSTRLTEVYDKCYNSYEDCRLRFRSADGDTSDERSLHPSDSVSQSKSNISSKLLERQIRLEQKRIELKAAYDLIKAQEAKAHAQKAEALANLRLEEARIETKQKLLDCSEKGSSVTVAQKSRVLSRRDSDGSVRRSSRAELDRDARVLKSLNELISTTRDGQAKRLANGHFNKIDVKEKTKIWVKGISDCIKNDVTVLKQIACNLENQNMVPMQSSFDQNSAVYH